MNENKPDHAPRYTKHKSIFKIVFEELIERGFKFGQPVPDEVKEQVFEKVTNNSQKTP